MYYLALLCENNNEVANIDFNNILTEINLKYKSDEYIIRRIAEEYNSDYTKKIYRAKLKLLTIKKMKKIILKTLIYTILSYKNYV